MASIYLLAHHLIEAFKWQPLAAWLLQSLEKQVVFESKYFCFNIKWGAISDHLPARTRAQILVAVEILATVKGMSPDAAGNYMLKRQGYWLKKTLLLINCIKH